MKRRLEDAISHTETTRSPKRRRQGTKVHLFDLSDELLLRIFACLPVITLSRCGKVCRKFRGLSEDNELWREKYYSQFVRHRARRLPSLRTTSNGDREPLPLYSSSAAPWLELTHFVKTRPTMRWKHLYKVKYNWTRGRARASEFVVMPQLNPPVIARLQNGDLYIADQVHGLRKWQGGCAKCHCSFEPEYNPSTMVVERYEKEVFVAVGFTNGSLTVYCLRGERFCKVAKRSMRNGSICALGMSWPYIISMSVNCSIDLFLCSDKHGLLNSVTSLHTSTEISPTSLSLRKTDSILIAGIAYAFNRFNTGWCLGLQELRLDLSGKMLDNRTSTSLDTPLRDTLKPLQTSTVISRSTYTAPFNLHPSFARAPNSLSYCGCYILAGLPDNTLMVYVVTSTDQKLEISMGRRLWGHTSAVSAAEVTSTGRALSISARSNEMRYWELEELLTSSSQKKASVNVQSLSLLDEVIHKRGNGLGLALKEVKIESEFFRRSVTFDDERAIVVGEKDEKQIISCFDFA